MSDKTCYLASAVYKNDFPITELPEIAMLGRSNVGKSSLINKLANRRNLARISGVPGKTRTINFYKIEDRFVLVDLPGYGYARVGKAEKKLWQVMIDGYLNSRELLKGLILIIDIRHSPTELDIQMLDWLINQNIPFIVVATKSDKISKNQKINSLKLIKQKLAGALGPEQLFSFSAVTGEGKDKLLSFLNAVSA